MTVAFRHHTGIGAPRSCDNAAYHYKKVADEAIEYWRSGPPGGRYTVRNSYRLADDEGGVYGEGASYISSGINKPKSKASESAKELDDILEYWDLLARKGNLFATFTLGKMYYDGSRQMPRNLSKAKAYFTSVVNKYWATNGKVIAGAPQGTERWAAQAAGQLGKMYLRGDGVPQDYTEAIMWFERGVLKVSEVPIPVYCDEKLIRRFTFEGRLLFSEWAWFHVPPWSWEAQKSKDGRRIL